MNELTRDESFMAQALLEARLAQEHGDVPVGAVVVCDGGIVGRGHNRREVDADPTAHAEILAIREAAKERGSWYLDGAQIFVTLEPCAMCAGAIVLSRIARVVYGADDPKAGACGGVLDITGDTRLNHQPSVVGGVMREECSELIRNFFRGLRARGNM